MNDFALVDQLDRLSIQNISDSNHVLLGFEADGVVQVSVLKAHVCQFQLSDSVSVWISREREYVAINLIISVDELDVLSLFCGDSVAVWPLIVVLKNKLFWKQELDIAHCRNVRSQFEINVKDCLVVDHTVGFVCHFEDLWRCRDQLWLNHDVYCLRVNNKLVVLRKS